MGKKLHNAPVYYTIALVQFNAILDIDSFVTEIQSKMRAADFPDFKKAVVQGIVFSPDVASMKPGQSAAPAVSSQLRYLFGDIDGTSLFLLDQNALSLQTTKYDTYGIFSEMFLKGLGILDEVLHLQLIERIGLRYLDAILPDKKKEETLEKFLIPEVLGLSIHNEGMLQHSVSENFFKSATRQIISRIIIRNGKVELPVELSQFTPAINQRFTQKEGLHAIIDTDVFDCQRERFILANVKNKLSKLHDDHTKSFRTIVTDDALNSWA